MCCSEKPSPRDQQYREWIWITYLCSIEYDVLLRILGKYSSQCSMSSCLFAVCHLYHQGDGSVSQRSHTCEQGSNALPARPALL